MLWMKFVILILCVWKVSAQECSSSSVNLQSGSVAGYQSSQYKHESYPASNAFDNDINTFIMTECTNNLHLSCTGVNFNFLDNNYAWYILHMNVQIAQFIKSVTITTPESYSQQLSQNLDILVGSRMSPKPNKLYGFRGVNWNDFTYCGTTGKYSSFTLTVNCRKAQNSQFVAIRRQQKTEAQLKAKWSLYFSEINFMLYNLVSNGGNWSENSSEIQSISVCTPGLSKEFKFKWYQKYFDGTSNTITASTNKLSLPSVTRYNAGVYHVQYLSSKIVVLHDSDEVVVRVKYRAKIINIQIVKLVLNENETLTVKCEASDGYPFPKLELLIQDNSIPETDLKVSNHPISKYGGRGKSIILTTRASRKMNKKLVKCKLEQDNFHIVNQEKLMEVHYGARKINFNINKIQLTEGETVFMKCSSSASYPHPVVKIFIENTALNVSETKNESDEFGGESQTVSVLSVVTREWNGKYVYCKLMQNNIITESSRHFITVRYAALIITVKVSNKTPTEFTSVKFICELESRGFPTADVIWKHNNTEMKRERNKTEITINNITFSQSGVYSCLTKNSAGFDVKSDSLSVKSRPAANSGAIIGGTFGALILIALIIVFSILAYRRFGNRTVNNSDHELSVEYNDIDQIYDQDYYESGNADNEYNSLSENQELEKVAAENGDSYYTTPQLCDYDEIGNTYMQQNQEVGISKPGYEESDTTQEACGYDEIGNTYMQLNQEVELGNEESDTTREACGYDEIGNTYVQQNQDVVNVSNYKSSQEQLQIDASLDQQNYDHYYDETPKTDSNNLPQNQEIDENSLDENE